MTIDFTDIMKNKTDYFSPEEINLILNRCYDIMLHCKQTNAPHLYKLWLRNYALFMTLYRTGRRISEIVGQRPFDTTPGLRPCDFYPDNLIEFSILKKNQIFNKTKSGNQKSPEKLIKERWYRKHKRLLMPVDSEYYKFMKDMIREINIPSHMRIFKITRQRADIILKQVANDVRVSRNYSKIHCHMFRHTYAVHFLKGNSHSPFALIQLKDLLAHSKIDITTTYTQFTPEDKLVSLERAFGQKEDENNEQD